jgi:hypothetical protein
MYVVAIFVLLYLFVKLTIWIVQTVELLAWRITHGTKR